MSSDVKVDPAVGVDNCWGTFSQLPIFCCHFLLSLDQHSVSKWHPRTLAFFF